jgi:hypothetical protein
MYASQGYPTIRPYVLPFPNTLQPPSARRHDHPADVRTSITPPLHSAWVPTYLLCLPFPPPPSGCLIGPALAVAIEVVHPTSIPPTAFNGDHRQQPGRIRGLSVLLAGSLQQLQMHKDRLHTDLPPPPHPIRRESPPVSDKRRGPRVSPQRTSQTCMTDRHTDRGTQKLPSHASSSGGDTHATGESQLSGKTRLTRSPHQPRSWNQVPVN